MAHVCLMIARLGGGGAERVVLRLARGLCERGHRVDLALFGYENAYPDELDERVSIFVFARRPGRFEKMRRRAANLLRLRKKAYPAVELPARAEWRARRLPPGRLLLFLVRLAKDRCCRRAVRRGGGGGFGGGRAGGAAGGLLYRGTKARYRLHQSAEVGACGVFRVLDDPRLSAGCSGPAQHCGQERGGFAPARLSGGCAYRGCVGGGEAGPYRRLRPVPGQHNDDLQSRRHARHRPARGGGARPLLVRRRPPAARAAAAGPRGGCGAAPGGSRRRTSRPWSMPFSACWSSGPAGS